MESSPRTLNTLEVGVAMGAMGHAAQTSGESSLRDVARFVRKHWAHVLVAPFLAILMTVVHEAAHAFAALVQGGTVTDFVVLPTSGRWGSMRYTFPEATSYSSTAISLAPYVLWFLIALAVAVVVASARARLSFALGSTLFVWAYVMPLGDIANAAFPYLRGSSNDLLNAFGPPTAIAILPIGLAVVVATRVGFSLQQRLYGEHALSRVGYAALSALFLLGLAVGIPTM